MGTDPSSSTTFGDLLRRYRVAAGLTQEELAERARLSPRAISDLERGLRTRPWRDTVQFLAAALELEAAERALFEAAARHPSAPSVVASDVSSVPEREVPRNNLPASLSTLIGREQEIAGVVALLQRSEVRLVTLTGPGGIGKTRLALQVADDVLDAFADGVVFIQLAAIADPNLVVPTIARTLDIPEIAHRPHIDVVKDWLRGRRLLLVLDNFEQVLPAAPSIVDLLATGPTLKVVVTSRAILHLRGEHEIAVPPLEIPDPRRVGSGRGNHVATLGQYAAVRLFVERASKVDHDFVLTDENAPAVVDICSRLDGLPLAIELAVARIRLLSPSLLLARLERRLPMLTGGARDLPARQQTLRDTIAWSYDLLDDGEKFLFRRLAVFEGGFALDAAEAIVEDGDDTLSQLESLVGQSLVDRKETAEGDIRFSILETVREYGVEQLAETRERDAVRCQHATYFLEKVERRESQWYLPRRAEWVMGVENERYNVRAALKFFVDCGDVTSSLRLAAALGPFWLLHGPLGEGRERLTKVLALSETSTSPLDPKGPGRLARAHALHWLGGIARRQTDYDAARKYREESLRILRELGDRKIIASSLVQLGNAELQGGDLTAARPPLEEAIAIARESQDRQSLNYSFEFLGMVALHEGDYAGARSLLQEAWTIARESEDRFLQSYALHVLGCVALEEGSLVEARAFFLEAQAMAREFDDRTLVAYILEGLAGLAVALASFERAIRLAGAANALRKTYGAPISPVWNRWRDQWLQPARAALDAEIAASAWAEGQAMTLDQAVAFAVEEDRES